MPRISVVVPVYNVEPYLDECLASIAGQSVEDLEVVLVEDGSSDRSPEIARAWVERDPRFRLIEQPNGGLGNARNNGAAAATGEFLAFVDSDDVLPLHAYELLLGSLDKTGSDFATGNVHRLTNIGTVQSPFLAKTFARTRPATHVTEFRALLADRIVPNKLWRKSFWDAHGYRFPEGVLHEDIAVVVPAQFAAKSVDVIADPVYHYRIRAGEDLSITQRRLEQRALRDRMTAIEHVSEQLGREGPRGSKRWYDESVVADDLRYYINVLDAADADYRQLFLDRVNAFLDTASPKIFDPLPAIERLKWHLVRRRFMDELVEVLRFQKQGEHRTTPPVSVDGHWYGDYPFRTDERLAIPAEVYLLDSELGLNATLDSLRDEDGKLVVEGWAYIDGVGAETADAHSMTLTALRRSRIPRRLRLAAGGVKLETELVARPEATAETRQPLRDLTWSGFRATLDPDRLRTLGRWRGGVWELFLTVRAGKLKRRTARFNAARMRPARAVGLAAPDGVLAKALTTSGGLAAIDVRSSWASVDGHRLVDGETLELTGRVHPAGGSAKVEAERRVDEATRELEAAVEAERFTLRVPLEELRKVKLKAAGRAAVAEAGETVWDLFLGSGDARQTIGLEERADGAAWPFAGGELSLFRTKKGDAALAFRTARPVLEEAVWHDDGTLDLAGRVPVELAGHEIVVAARRHEETYPFRLDADGDGRFRARLTPARVRSLAGDLPLREGAWDLFARPAGSPNGAQPVPLMIAPELYAQLPLRMTVRHKPFALGMSRTDRAVLFVERDLDDDERGPFNQRRLATTAYRPGRSEPLRDAVVYTSFGGRQFSDSPRAIYEELVRRDAPAEHVWVVRDGMTPVPDGATLVREGSRQHFEALAQARYVVTNDHFPDWFARRDEQVCVQTWHGTPLKRLGLDVSQTRKEIRRFQHRWDQQVANWQYVISPNRFSTSILRRAYAIGGEMLETGYPRDDILASPQREELSARLRRRLDIPDGVRTVLYAPTYRDHVIERGRYRLDLHLDIDRLHAAVGDDTVLLFRKHHYVADAVPAGPNGFVRDVSSYPDGTELMLAADVLVTDYSSMMFDYANTGRPMLFFTYDLEAYGDVIRGFYLDFVAEAPGPLLSTTDELASALGDLDRTAAEYASRYEKFAARYCELDDGHASKRVVDSIFPW